MKNFFSRLQNFIWNKMELNRIKSIVFISFRSIMRIIEFPVWIIDNLVTLMWRKFQKNIQKPKEPTEKQIRQKMVANIIDGIVANKNSVFSTSAINRLKWWCIALLEIASAITTTIGMTIIAADISPAIAIIWAFVIQGLAGSLSGFRGKWNNIILAICMIFSIASDYVCYVNAVFPYDYYIESVYTDFKTSYDPAWEKAMSIVQVYESPEERINTAFNNVDSRLELLKQIYNDQEVAKIQTDIENKQSEIENVKPLVTQSQSRGGYVDNQGNWHSENTTSSSQSDNYSEKEYLRKQKEELESKKNIIQEGIIKLNSIELAYSQLKSSEDANVKDTAKRLFKQQDNQQNTSSNEFARFSGEFYRIQEEINGLLSQSNNATINVVDLSDTKRANENYNIISELKLPNFSEIRKEVTNENNTFFDIIFDWGATIIDSEFATNAVDMKKKAEFLTNDYYEKFIEATADLVTQDSDLNRLIYGNNDIKNTDIPSLKTAYSNVQYQDALSKAFTYLKEPSIETYSRVLYACLADGLVLLIGFSLRRRRTSIYRIHNRRDLVNDESRLISEAFYNLSARPIRSRNTIYEAYKISTLLFHLNQFISCFEPEPFMSDANLNMSYSLVCKKEGTIKYLNREYKELIGLLVTLKYIKPISVEQYNFFVKYKRNKASIDSKNIENALPNLDGKCEEYYYLMTEGFSLYFSEKINDLYQHKESDVYRNEIVKTLYPETENTEEA